MFCLVVRNYVQQMLMYIVRKACRYVFWKWLFQDTYYKPNTKHCSKKFYMCYSHTKSFGCISYYLLINNLKQSKIAITRVSVIKILNENRKNFVETNTIWCKANISFTHCKCIQIQYGFSISIVDYIIDIDIRAIFIWNFE